jgi:diketogulonate reductase-like aldo/keto reductase
MREVDPPLVVGGVRVPRLLYGTAWKEDATEAMVTAALAAGFVGFDTANQRTHYFEEGVGRALRAALEGGRVTRDELFVQTKFTFRDGQDDRLPYDPRAPVAEQVAQSHARSLEHLGVDRIDSLVLHGPSRRHGLGPDDHAAWRAMEALAGAGQVRLLGVSNIDAAQLEELAGFAAIAPAFVQNRCYADRGWDREVRAVCAARGYHYQGFSLLTANRHVVGHRRLIALAERHRRTPAQVVFRFAIQRGMIALTGTTDPVHMREDLAALTFELGASDLELIESLS